MIVSRENILKMIEVLNLALLKSNENNEHDVDFSVMLSVPEHLEFLFTSDWCFLAKTQEEADMVKDYISDNFPEVLPQWKEEDYMSFHIEVSKGNYEGGTDYNREKVNSDRFIEINSAQFKYFYNKIKKNDRI